jgi:hypothetical protein
VYPLARQQRGYGQRLGALLFLLPFSVLAQSALTPPPAGFGGVDTQLPASSTNQNLVPNIVPSPEPPELPAIFHWNQFDFRPHLLYRFVYADGLQSSPGNKPKTTINEVYAGATLAWGKNWTLDYTPTLRYYSSPQFQDGLDQSIELDGAAQVGDWAFNLKQSYTDTTQPLVETGLQSEQETYLTSLVGTWAMNSALNLQVGLIQNLRYVTGFQSLEEWNTPDWLDYRLNPQLTVGLGVTLGYDALGASPAESFEQGQGRLTWKPGDKLTLQMNGGIEERQLGGGAPDLVSPIFGLEVTYQALEHTRVDLRVSRTVSPSVFQDQVLTTTSVNGSIVQDISRKLTAELDGVYINRPFQNTALVPLLGPYTNTAANQAVSPVPVSILSTTREDNNWECTVRLRWAVIPRGTVEVFYSLSENSSGLSNFKYSSTQVGFSLGYRF